MSQADADILGCHDGSCPFTAHLGGMRTNGGCRCLYRLDDKPGQNHRVGRFIRDLIKDNEALRKSVYQARMKER